MFSLAEFDTGAARLARLPPMSSRQPSGSTELSARAYSLASGRQSNFFPRLPDFGREDFKMRDGAAYKMAGLPRGCRCLPRDHCPAREGARKMAPVCRRAIYDTENASLPRHLECDACASMLPGNTGD